MECWSNGGRVKELLLIFLTYILTSENWVMMKEALDLITLGPVARKCLGRAYL